MSGDAGLTMNLGVTRTAIRLAHSLTVGHKVDTIENGVAATRQGRGLCPDQWIAGPRVIALLAPRKVAVVAPYARMRE